MEGHYERCQKKDISITSLPFIEREMKRLKIIKNIEFKKSNSIKNIYTGKKFKVGSGQACEYHKNTNKKYKFNPKEDKEDHTKTLGIGVYCSPNPDVMEEYANSAEINGKNYLMGFMMRVKPDKIRISEEKPDYWVLNGTTKEMRPYRLMIKEC